MDPRKNARRGYAKRQQEREEARRQAASEWKYEFTPKEGKKMKTYQIVVLVVVLACSCLACFALGYLVYNQAKFTPAVESPNTVAPTNTVAQPTLVPEPTKVPEPTLAPTLAPIAMSCDTPSIKTSKDGVTFAENGEFLDTILGKRMTRTTRLDVYPEIAWNTPLSADELKNVEVTWVYYQVCVPKSMFGRIFAGGFEQGVNRYENGVLMTLQPGLYEFKIRNGEVVLWYPNQDGFAEADFSRIIEQIRNGNFDIKAPLAFFGVTTDLLPHIPTDMVQERNVQIIPFAEPVVK